VEVVYWILYWGCSQKTSLLEEGPNGQKLSFSLFIKNNGAARVFIEKHAKVFKEINNQTF